MNIAVIQLDTNSLKKYIDKRYQNTKTESLIFLMNKTTLKQLIIDNENTIRYYLPLKKSSDGYYTLFGIKIAIADWLEFGEVNCYEI